MFKNQINEAKYYNLLNSVFRGKFSMESQPQNTEFRNNPENFHPIRAALFLFTHEQLQLEDSSQSW